MPRCQSRIKEWTATGQDGKIRQCTREEGHPMDEENHDMHQNLTPGHRSRWPDRAAVGAKKYLMILSAPPGKDFFDISEDLGKLAEQYPAYGFLLSEMSRLELSEDRTRRIY